MTKPKLPTIKVFHYGGDEPRVVLPRGLKATVKFLDQEEKDLLIVRYKGVSVYQAVKDFDIVSTDRADNAFQTKKEAPIQLRVNPAAPAKLIPVQ